MKPLADGRSASVKRPPASKAAPLAARRASQPAAPKGRERARVASAQRRERKTQEKRRAIMDAALSLFSRYGMHGVSLDAVAELADVSKTNLLYYFPSKEELYLSVLRDVLAQWLEPLEALQADQPPRAALSAYIRTKLAASRDAPQASRLFCLEVIQGAPLLKQTLEGQLRALVERKGQVIRQWIDQGVMRAVEPRHLIFSLWAVTQHYADFSAQVQSICGQGLDDPAFFEETVANVEQIILNGVLVPPPA